MGRSWPGAGVVAALIGTVITPVLAFALEVKTFGRAGVIGPGAQGVSGLGFSAVVGPAVGPGRQADQAPSSGRLSSAPWAAPGRAGGKLGCAVVRHSYLSRHRSLWCRARR